MDPAEHLGDARLLSLCPAARGLLWFIQLSSWLSPEPGIIRGDDPRVWCALARCTPQEWRRHREAVLGCFEREDNAYVLASLRDTKRTQKRKMRERSEAGKRAAKERWGKEKDAVRIASALRTQSDRTASSGVGVGSGVGVEESKASQPAKSEALENAPDAAGLAGSADAAHSDGQQRTPPVCSAARIAEIQARHPGVDVAAVAEKCAASPKVRDPDRALSSWVRQAEKIGADRREAPAAPAACPVCGGHDARLANGRAYCRSADHAGGLEASDGGWYVHRAGACECGRSHDARDGRPGAPDVLRLVGDVARGIGGRP